MLWGLDEAEKVWRVEMFARASLLYEIFSGTKPFEDLTDDEVQDRFSNGKFPNDAISLPHSLNIYSGWSEEFAQKLIRWGMVLSYDYLWCSKVLSLFFVRMLSESGKISGHHEYKYFHGLHSGAWSLPMHFLDCS